MYTAETKKYRLRLDQDIYSDSPRDFAEDTVFLTWESRYNSPDSNPFSQPADFEEWAEEESLIYLPVYRYEHSGVIYSTTPFSSRFDSGQVGYIYLEPHKAKETQHEQAAQAILERDVQTYSDWAEGNVWFLELERKVECACCKHPTYEEYESFGGLIGDPQNMNFEAWLTHVVSKKDIDALVSELF